MFIHSTTGVFLRLLFFYIYLVQRMVLVSSLVPFVPPPAVFVWTCSVMLMLCTLITYTFADLIILSTYSPILYRLYTLETRSLSLSSTYLLFGHLKCIHRARKTVLCSSTPLWILILVLSWLSWKCVLFLSFSQNVLLLDHTLNIFGISFMIYYV